MSYGRNPRPKASARLVAAASAVAMLVMLAVGGTAFAWDDDAGTAPADADAAVVQPADQTQGTGGATVGGTDDGSGTVTDGTSGEEPGDPSDGPSDGATGDESGGASGDTADDAAGGTSGGVTDDADGDMTDDTSGGATAGDGGSSAGETAGDDDGANGSADADDTDDDVDGADDGASDDGASDSSDDTADAAPAADFAADAAYAGHTVTGVTPSNVTMDLFDYWITGQDDADNGADTYQNMSRGINDGHALKFVKNGFGTEGGNYGRKAPDDASINNWTGKTDTDRGGPFSGIVTDTLGKDGYPVLASGNRYLGSRRNLTKSTTDTTSQDSLAYLFAPTTVAGKQAFTNVRGLLQADENGLYGYDSQKNFASFDSGSNAFVLYDAPAVSADSSVADQQNGQFFPFNSAGEVFENPDHTDAAGHLVMDDSVSSSSAALHHYFGLHMTSDFVQPADGKVNGTAMQFNFSGDDDVWVYIDGILVGDLGGLHDRITLNIDFATGEVTVRNGSSYDSTTEFNATGGRVPTLRSLMNGKTNADGHMFTDADFDGNTFISGGEHTLDFFYLERGNGNSNMQLSTNLLSRPANDLIKVDQNGQAIDGASFALYKADADYAYDETSDLVARGATGTDGVLTFIDESTGRRINFDLYHQQGVDHYVLKETETPAGYRTAADTKLVYYTGGADVGQQGLLLADPSYLWQTGAYATAKETVTITNGSDISSVNGEYYTEDDIDYELEHGGELYAVVLKRDSEHYGDTVSDADTWRVVSGDPLNGWTLSEPVKDIDQVSANTAAHYDFDKKEGMYRVTLENLPGDIRYYYNMLDSSQKHLTQFTVGYYLTKADHSTVRLTGRQFSRVFASRLQITDVRNYLLVQKTDEDGDAIATTVNGKLDPTKQAEFALYAADQVDVAADGTATLKEDATPYDTTRTRDLTRAEDGLDLTGGAVFPSASADGGPNELSEGTYYLEETKAPDGYTVNDHLVMVIVDADGVHANAGTDDDLIATRVGVGSLIASMAQTGNADQVDQTMHDITATKKTGVLGEDGRLTWTTVAGSDVHLSYGGAGVALEYGLSGTQDADPISYYSAIGWTWFGTRQHYDCAATYKGGHCGTTTLKLNLSQAPYDNPDTTKLFSGTTTVIVGDRSNRPTTVLSLVKRVEGRRWDGTSDFTFTLTRVDDAGDDTVTYPQAGGTDGAGGDTPLNKGGTLTVSTTGTIAAGQGGQKTLRFARLAFPATDATYEFRITETIPQQVPAGWHYDTGGLNQLNDDTGYRVTVAVRCDAKAGSTDGCVTTVTYGDATGEPDPDTGTVGTPPVFVNAYATVSALPFTGGDASARDWLTGGTIVAAAALAMGAAYARRRRRALGV